MPDTKIGEWDSLTEYMISIARDDGTTAAYSSQDDNKTDCVCCCEDDHAKQYEDTQVYEQIQEHFKVMSVSSTQAEKQHLYCLMARVVTPATPLVALSAAMPALQLSLGGEDGDCGVALAEDEAGTEFKFCDDEPASVFRARPRAQASDCRHWVGELAAHRDREASQAPPELTLGQNKPLRPNQLSGLPGLAATVRPA